MKSKDYLTSKDNGHRHTWNPDFLFTSSDDGHVHGIDIKKRIALKANNHTHKLLKKLKVPKTQKERIDQHNRKVRRAEKKIREMLD